MDDDDIRESMERLEKLSSQSRQRIQEVLKKALERETVAGSVGGGAAAANIFSRGWVFSRLTPTAADLAGIRELPGISDLSPAEFTEFAGRLAELKRKSDPQR
jgi:hypothetical protein